MIIIYDDLYGKTYRNVTDVLFRDIPVFGVQKYRIEFRYGGGKTDVLWLDSTPIRRYCYIQLDNERYGYYKIKENERKFMLKLNNELVKTAVDSLPD